MNPNPLSFRLADSGFIDKPMNETLLAHYFSTKDNRFKHIQGVAEEMAALLERASVEKKVAADLMKAAYLHDIGYSKSLAGLQFHPLDGALHCAREGFSKPIVSAVMFHSGAYQDVQEHYAGLAETYDRCFLELDATDTLFIQLVTYCDLHRSSTGQKVSFQTRIDEIIQRYGKHHKVSRFMTAQIPYFQQVIKETETWVYNQYPANP